MAANPKMRSVTRTRIDMRVPDAALHVIDRAVELEHTDRTSFMVAAAVERAKAALLEQVLFPLDEADYETVISAPTKPNAALRAFARDKSPWPL